MSSLELNILSKGKWPSGTNAVQYSLTQFGRLCDNIVYAVCLILSDKVSKFLAICCGQARSLLKNAMSGVYYNTADMLWLGKNTKWQMYKWPFVNVL